MKTKICCVYLILALLILLGCENQAFNSRGGQFTAAVNMHVGLWFTEQGRVFLNVWKFFCLLD